MNVHLRRSIIGHRGSIDNNRAEYGVILLFEGREIQHRAVERERIGVRACQSADVDRHAGQLAMRAEHERSGERPREIPAVAQIDVHISAAAWAVVGDVPTAVKVAHLHARACYAAGTDGSISHDRVLAVDVERSVGVDVERHAGIAKKPVTKIFVAAQREVAAADHDARADLGTVGIGIDAVQFQAAGARLQDAAVGADHAGNPCVGR